jgi:hypothetical protein
MLSGAEHLEHLHNQMAEIMRVNPQLHLATVSPTGWPHASTVWFAPDEKMEQLFWLSSPNRVHSRHIAEASRRNQRSRGKGVPVAGSMSTEQQTSKPVAGLAFEGRADRVTDTSEVKEALGILVANHMIFIPGEAEGYLQAGGKSGLPHQVYKATIDHWTDFDNRPPRQPEEHKIKINPDGYLLA